MFQTEVQLHVTKKEVEDFSGVGNFRCECVAWNKRGSERTRPVGIEVACKLIELEVSRSQNLRMRLHLFQSFLELLKFDVKS